MTTMNEDTDLDQSTETGTGESQPDYLAMSDEEILALEAPPVAGPAATTPDVTNTEGDTSPENTGTDDAQDGEGDADEAGGQPAKEKDPEGGRARDAQGRFTTKEGEEETPPASTEEATPKEGEGETPPADSKPDIDYKAEYERLLAPFKANGREVKIDSIDDAISLMQMGANYNKKMAALKPNIKLMKMLENAGLMSEERIGYLIDLTKKNPQAISKLVKESGLDPLDLDAEKAGTYKPTSYAVDDREIELDTVLGELNDSPTYTRTLDVVSNKWDAASKQTIAQNPQLLKVIDGHIANGIYDLISTELERDRMLGRLNGLSDIEAYRRVGDAINARGGFNHLLQKQGQPKPQEPVIVQPKPTKVDDDKLKDKKRAAAATKPAAPAAPAADFNPLAMSDEEFSKLAAPKFR